MADAEDKEKAEKLAAAKKRFEQLKKQKQGAKKAGAKKKDTKSEDASSKADEAEEKPEAEGEVDADGDDVAGGSIAQDTETKTSEAATTSADAQKLEGSSPSLTLQSRQRSESFRKAAGDVISSPPKSGTLAPIDSETEVQELYRKQAARIEELEKQVETLGKTQEKLDKAEEELDKLREDNINVIALKAKATLADERASEIEKIKADLSSTQRQLTQAQQAASNKNRRASEASPNHELNEQLASKTSTIESLELELSNLRYQISSLEADKSGLDNKLRDLESRATRAEESSKSLQEEHQKLKDTLTTPATEPEAKGDEDVPALQAKISTLQSELKLSQTSIDTATNKATNLETKVDTLTKLHRESSTQNAAKEKEIKDLKSRIRGLSTARTDAAGEDLSDLEDEEREKLHARIRDLEAETFELRRGVWRDKRAALQPGIQDDEGAIASPPSGSKYEDVDLNGYFSSPYGSGGHGARPSFGGISAAGRQTSTFSDVLQSGISAFTGRENPRATKVDGSHVARKASEDLMSEDFDEDAFRAAHEADATARIERVREVKRGLEKWRGWRLDLAEQRQGGVPGFPAGPVFEA